MASSHTRGRAGAVSSALSPPALAQTPRNSRDSAERLQAPGRGHCRDGLGGGESGIRTHGTLWVHTLSKRAPSAARPSLRQGTVGGEGGIRTLGTVARTQV